MRFRNWRYGLNGDRLSEPLTTGPRGLDPLRDIHRRARVRLDWHLLYLNADSESLREHKTLCEDLQSKILEAERNSRDTINDLRETVPLDRVNYHGLRR